MTFTTTAWPLFSEDNYFASGSNHEGEIRGLVRTGANVGCAINEIGPTGLAALEDAAGLLTKVFADSGAFHEVHFPGGVPTVKKAISHDQWVKRLARYKRLGRVLGRQLYAVAPDMVAFQAETLERLERYAADVRELYAMGVNVIVAVQKGALSMAQFAERAIEILGFDDMVWGIPSAKDATSTEDIASFCDWLHATGKLTRLHLLGMGVRAERYGEVLAAIAMHSPGTKVFSDSVRIVAMVGREKRKSGKVYVRRYTAAQDAAKANGAKNPTEWKQQGMQRVLVDEMVTDAQAARRAGWFDPELESAPGVPLEEGCISYGPGGPFGHGYEAPALAVDAAQAAA